MRGKQDPRRVTEAVTMTAAKKERLASLHELLGPQLVSGWKTKIGVQWSKPWGERRWTQAYRSTRQERPGTSSDVSRVRTLRS